MLALPVRTQSPTISLPPTVTTAVTAASAEVTWNPDYSVNVICPECRVDPANTVEEFASGDVVCSDCGLVLGDRIVDTRSEWRTFSNDDQTGDDPSRVGEAANPLLNGAQLSTSIAYVKGGASRELHKAQTKSTECKSSKGLLAAYKEIGAFCDSIGIQKVVSDAAKQLFKLVDDKKAFKGKSQEAVIAGCIFIACRQCDVPRTFREIFALTKVPKKDIGRVFKSLEKFFADMGAGGAGGQAAEDSGYKATSSTKAHDLMIRFCNNLLLGNQCVLIAQGIAERAADTGTLAGRSPISCAAACIYVASHLVGTPKTPKQISVTAGVSEGTIKNAYKHLWNDREKLIDQKWLGKGKGDLALLPGP